MILLLALAALAGVPGPTHAIYTAGTDGAWVSPPGPGTAAYLAAASPHGQDAQVSDTLGALPGVEVPEITAEERARLEGVQQLLAIYRRIPGLRDVRIDLSGGILELSGTAISAEARDAAVDHAREIVPDVAFVDASALLVETDPRRRIEPVVERIREQGLAFLRFIPTLLLGFLVVALGALAASWAGNRRFFIERVARNPFARNLLRQVVRAVVFMTALLLALDFMGVTALVGAVLGAAGVAGIAVGFAFRDIVENYLAGILLSLRQPFAPNDHVQIAGEEGRVVRLTGRETVLMTLDGNHVRIPNAMVFKSVIINMTRNPRRRFLFDVGIAPSESVGTAIATARAAVTGVNGVLETPAVAVRLHALGDSTTAVRISGWVDQTESDFDKVRSQALRAAKEAFVDAGIVIPPPEFRIRLLEDPRGEVGGLASVPPGVPDERPSRGHVGSAAHGSVDAATGGTVGGPSRSVLIPALGEDAGNTVDVSPDTTIEDEIAREHRESDEEDLLQPPPEAP